MQEERSLLPQLKKDLRISKISNCRENGNVFCTCLKKRCDQHIKRRNEHSTHSRIHARSHEHIRKSCKHYFLKQIVFNIM